MIKSLKYNELCLEELRTKIRPLVEIRWHGRQHGELVNYCATCDQEVFNILYTKQQIPQAAAGAFQPLYSSSNSASGGNNCIMGNDDLVSSTCVSSTSGSGMNSGQQDFNSSSRKPQVFVYCRSCAFRISANLQQFVILQEYKIEDLTLILNHFKLVCSVYFYCSCFTQVMSFWERDRTKVFNSCKSVTQIRNVNFFIRILGLWAGLSRIYVWCFRKWRSLRRIASADTKCGLCCQVHQLLQCTKCYSAELAPVFTEALLFVLATFVYVFP